MNHRGRYYKVRLRWSYTGDYLKRGFEFERDYQKALKQMCERFGGRVGECVDVRNEFILLKFSDTPDARPIEAWLPKFLLQRTANIPGSSKDQGNVKEALLDSIFEFV